MSAIEKGIEIAKKWSMKKSKQIVKDDEITELKQRFTLQIAKRETQLNEARRELAMLQTKNDEIRKHNDELEMNKKVLDGQLKQMNERIMNDAIKIQSLHIEIEKLENDCRMEIQEAKEYHNLFNKVIQLRNRDNYETKCFKEDLKNKNIAIFKDILRKVGCNAARDIGKTFPEIHYYDDDGDLTPNGKVVVISSGYMNVYDYKFETCFECRNWSKKKCKYILQ